MQKFREELVQVGGGGGVLVGGRWRERVLVDIGNTITNVMGTNSTSANCTVSSEKLKKRESHYRTRVTQALGLAIVLLLVVALYTQFVVAKQPDDSNKPNFGLFWKIVDTCTGFTDDDGVPSGYFEYLAENHDLVAIFFGDMRHIARNLRIVLFFATMSLFFALAVFFGSINRIYRFCKPLQEYQGQDMKDAAIHRRNWLYYPFSSMLIVFTLKSGFTLAIKIWAAAVHKSPPCWQHAFCWTCTTIYVGLFIGSLIFQATLTAGSFIYYRLQAYLFIFLITQVFAWVVGDNIVNSLFWCFAKGEYDHFKEKHDAKLEREAEKDAEAQMPPPPVPPPTGDPSAPPPTDQPPPPSGGPTPPLPPGRPVLDASPVPFSLTNDAIPTPAPPTTSQPPIPTQLPPGGVPPPGPDLIPVAYPAPRGMVPMGRSTWNPPPGGRGMGRGHGAPQSIFGMPPLEDVSPMEHEQLQRRPRFAPNRWPSAGIPPYRQEAVGRPPDMNTRGMAGEWVGGRSEGGGGPRPLYPPMAGGRVGYAPVAPEGVETRQVEVVGSPGLVAWRPPSSVYTTDGPSSGYSTDSSSPTSGVTAAVGPRLTRITTRESRTGSRYSSGSERSPSFRIMLND